MLKEILDSSKYICENSKYVSINYDILDNIINNSDFNNLKHWLNANPFNIMNINIEDLVVYLLVYHSICFSTWGNPK